MFHVFDPRHVEDVLDRDLVTVWREQDAITAADNRRRAAAKAAMSRSKKQEQESSASGGKRRKTARQQLQGWDDFESGGLLK
jgi:hypothetical protein